MLAWAAVSSVVIAASRSTAYYAVPSWQAQFDSPSVASLLWFVQAWGVLSCECLWLATAAPLRLSGLNRGGLYSLVAGLLAVGVLLADVQPLSGALFNAALVVLVASLGAMIGARVEAMWHLSIAGLLVSVADLWSVSSSLGPTRQLLEREHLLSFVAVSWPFVEEGTVRFRPVLGIGDITMLALFLGAVRAHGVSLRRAVAGLFLGLALDGVFLVLAREPVPALPAIAFGFVAMVPESRTIPIAERTKALKAVAAILAFGVVGMMLRLIDR